jgi:hypothetical protein
MQNPFNMQFAQSNLYLMIQIRRDHLIEDALTKLAQNRKNLKKPMKVQFIGEPGIDEGGVRKEFFTLVVD